MHEPSSVPEALLSAVPIRSLTLMADSSDGPACSSATSRCQRGPQPPPPTTEHPCTQSRFNEANVLSVEDPVIVQLHKETVLSSRLVFNRNAELKEAPSPNRELAPWVAYRT